MTQWLVEEAVVTAARLAADRDDVVASEDVARHARLTDMALRAARGGA